METWRIRFNHEPVAGAQKIPSKTRLKDLRNVAAIDAFSMTCHLSINPTS
jgi:hypothetical protein